MPKKKHQDLGVLVKYSNTSEKKFLTPELLWSLFDKVIFIDRFFSTDEMEKMFYELQTRSENGKYPSNIAIICINHYREVNTMNRQRQNVPLNIHVHKMLPTLKKYAAKNTIYDIHDRFAIMDNEIWHFGSTLGGHMNKLTAFSRGWTDINGKFREYAQEPYR